MPDADIDMNVDELPLDLLAQVERRLGVDRQAALEVLGRWLAAYEPVARGKIRFLK
jgi:hypothetical protein